MHTELFAIKHKPSGGYLPEVHKGYTHSEPRTFGIPRLFERKSSAKKALTWWLGGAHSVATSYVHAPWGEELDVSWVHEDRPERRAEDMEVVPVFLVLT